jgi:phosphopantothenoylcysteine synthetase/decarboxylase
MSRVVLGVSASVAIYKACDLASQLTQAGDEVRVVMTPNAAKLVSPQLFEAVSGQPAAVDEFGGTREGAMDHITLARWAEALVVAPATANTLGRLACGLADDLLGSLALAVHPAKTKRMLAPAMNPVMFASPAVQRNLAQLVEDGWALCEPDSGRVACEDVGPGRLAEPQRIAEALAELLAS